MSTLFDHGRYGLERPAIVRVPHTEGEAVHCPECGRDITETCGTVRFPTGAVVDRDIVRHLGETRGNRSPSFGWSCRHGDYRVICPRVVSRPSAPGMRAGWVGVPVEFADGAVRHVPLPARELPYASDGGERQ